MRKGMMIGGFLLALLGTPAMANWFKTSAGPVEVLPVVADLDTPWSVAFLPDGGWLITEREGTLLLIGADGERRPVSGIPDVRASGQGGLFDVVLDPDFATSRVIYLSYAEPVDFRSARTAVARAVLEGDRLADLKVIFRQDPATTGGRHFGGRIVPDGHGGLFVTLGDRGEAQQAQDLTNHLGKIVHITDDGQPRSGAARGKAFKRALGTDLPPLAKTDIWSFGHRNPQGAALDQSGQLWTVEHGARGGDEVNRSDLGKNYGWPVISYGTHYSGAKIGTGTAHDGMEQPAWYWDPSIAPSGMMIYSGKLWSEWAGDIFVGSLKFDTISRLDRDGATIAREERILDDRYPRIRDVREGPDGAIWFLSVGDGALYRMRPAD